MHDLTNQFAELEVYRNVYETWRFEVDSYWQRNTYFAAFETAAIGGCWYLLEKPHLVIGLLFAVLGTGLSLLWLWNNVAVHKYIKYWWQCAKDTERVLSLKDNAIDFATNHPGSSLRPSLGAKLVPVIFVLAWLSLIVYAICHLLYPIWAYCSERCSRRKCRRICCSNIPTHWFDIWYYLSRTETRKALGDPWIGCGDSDKTGRGSRSFEPASQAQQRELQPAFLLSVS
jgi:hypothetical protein